MLTRFERLYLCLEPFFPPIYGAVREKLKALVRSRSALHDGASPRILDVGGRKSHYTIGVRGLITVSDLPRETDLQKQLNLGANDATMAQTRARRSNIEDLIYDDMTESRLSDEEFDIVVSVEVLEHVERDGRFLDEVARVLKPGGVFLMTTPNGDFVRNTNPDHKRHYHRDQLLKLLSDRFSEARVDYAIVGGRSRRMGLRPWSPRRPLVTVGSMGANLVNRWLSRRPAVSGQSQGSYHLIAVAQKAGGARFVDAPGSGARVAAREGLVFDPGRGRSE